MVFADSSFPQLSLSLRYVQSPNFCKLFLQGLRAFFVLLIASPQRNHFWLHWDRPWLVRWTPWIFVLWCLIPAIVPRRLLWRGRQRSLSTGNLSLLSRKPAAFLADFTKRSLVSSLKAGAFVLLNKALIKFGMFLLCWQFHCFPHIHVRIRSAPGFSISSWHVLRILVYFQSLYEGFGSGRCCRCSW